MDVFGAQNRAMDVIQHLCRCGPEEHASKPAGMSRHNNQIKSNGSRHNLFGRVTTVQYSGAACERELGFQKRIDLAPRNAPALLSNLPGSAHVKFETILDTCERYQSQCHCVLLESVIGRIHRGVGLFRLGFLSAGQCGKLELHEPGLHGGEKLGYDLVHCLRHSRNEPQDGTLVQLGCL